MIVEFSVTTPRRVNCVARVRDPTCGVSMLSSTARDPPSSSRASFNPNQVQGLSAAFVQIRLRCLRQRNFYGPIGCPVILTLSVGIDTGLRGGKHVIIN